MSEDNEIEYQLGQDNWVAESALVTVRDVVLKNQIKVSRDCITYVLNHAPARRVGTETVRYGGLRRDVPE